MLPHFVESATRFGLEPDRSSGVVAGDLQPVAAAEPRVSYLLMFTYVLGQIFHRRTRSILTILGVAIGVILVTLTVGLARGQLAERGRREAGAGAEILVRPGGTGISAIQATLSINLDVADEIREVAGIANVVPLGQHFERSESGFGWRSIDGIDFDSYSRISQLQIVEGRVFEPGSNEAIVDTTFARDPNGRVGNTIEFGGRPYTIVGVYSPESMSRIKVPISNMQEYYSARNSASMLLVDVEPGASVEEAARHVSERLPGYQIILSRDLPNFYASGIPALNSFLNVVVSLALIVSTLVILLTMYTTVIERTRQIGILKSLGASRAFIAAVIESEALALSILGVAVGFGISVVAAYGIRSSTSLQIEFETSWFIATGIVGLLSGVLGALYPALRAASMDPVEALAHE